MTLASGAATLPSMNERVGSDVDKGKRIQPGDCFLFYSVFIAFGGRVPLALEALLLVMGAQGSPCCGRRKRAAPMKRLLGAMVPKGVSHEMLFGGKTF